MSTLQKHGRDYVHLYKNEQKGFCPGGILSYILLLLLLIIIIIIIIIIIALSNISKGI